MRLKYLGFLVLILSHIIPAAIKASETSTSTDSNSGSVILLVEDNENQRKNNSRALQLAFKKYKVMAAENIDKALEIIREHNPVLVITDGKLESHTTDITSKEKALETYKDARDGVALIITLKKEHPLIPVMMFSGESPEYLRFALEEGAIRVLSKDTPSSLKVLKEVVDELLKSSTSHTND